MRATPWNLIFLITLLRVNDIPTHIDLFSGIGGFALAARWAGVETVAFCEIEPYVQRVLRKNFPGVPIIEDVRDFPADEFQRPWLITGGYPCQPFSQDGKRRGEEDDRHLWPAMFEIIRSCRPDWVLAENVAGHVSMGLDEVLSDLESEDYTCQPLIVPACAVDAPHRRDRVWIVAYAESLGHRGRSGQECGNEKRIVQQEEQGRDTMGREAQGCSESCRKDVANAESVNDESSYKGRRSPFKFGNSNRGGNEHKGWTVEPDVDRVAHGIPSRVDQLRGLGNAIVPQVAYEIINAMIISNNQK